MNHDKAFSLVKDFFEERNCKIIKPKHANANGPDMTVITENSAFRVEIKLVSRNKNGSYRTEKIDLPRRNDDFVAVVFPCGYIYLEEMKLFLSKAGRDGARSFTVMIELLNLRQRRL